MRLTIYGRSVVLKVLLLSLAIDIAALFIPNEIIKLTLLVVSVFLMAFTLYFFRDPLRELPPGFKENEIEMVANWICDILDDINNQKNIERIKKEALDLCAKFPVYEKNWYRV